ncbi:MAG: HD domain-containing phosphohydrolase [Chloroflexota bacterium]
MDSAHPIRILFVEDVPDDMEIAARVIRREGLAFTSLRVDTEEEFVAALAEFQPDVIVSDYAMPQFDGMRALHISLARAPALPFIVLTGTLNEETAVKCIKAGATDYVIKERITRLPFAVKEALAQHEALRAKESAEQALRESEAQYRLLAENMSDTIWLMDMNLRTIYISPSVIRTRGYTLDELNALPLDQQLTPDSLARAMELLAEALSPENLERPEPRTTYSVELEFFRKDGSKFWSENTFTLILDQDKQPVNILGTGRDVTERKQAEEKLRESEARFSTIFHASPVAIAITRLEDNRLSDVNEAYQHLTGYTRAEIIGHTAYELNLWVVPEERERLIKTVREQGTVRDLEVQVRQKSGKIRTVLFSAELIELMGERHMLTLALDITERKRAEQSLRQRLERLQALRAVDQAIAASLDLRITLDILLDQALTQLGIDAAAVLLLDPVSHTLKYTAGRGFHMPLIKTPNIRLGESYAGRVAAERRRIYVTEVDTADRAVPFARLWSAEGFKAYWGVPLIAKGEVKGVMEVFQRADFARDSEWLEFLETLAGQAAITIDNIRLFDGLQRANMDLSIAYDATIEGWSRAMDLRDKETEGHTRRVTETTLALARTMGLPEDDLIHIRRGALLHDIGKMGVPDNILFKPDQLTAEEWKVMRQHPQLAHEMLAPISQLQRSLDIPYCHHEKWDGTGYPQGLREEQIPLAARIFAVVDVWDALTSDRPYRKAWTKENALAYIREQSGKHFDPQVVEVFLQKMRSGLV